MVDKNKQSHIAQPHRIVGGAGGMFVVVDHSQGADFCGTSGNGFPIPKNGNGIVHRQITCGF